jgi:cell division protease FtsH
VVPPVEIPQEVRDRVHAASLAEANGHLPESDSGVILTPPGSGGDVHDPSLPQDGGLPGSGPTPPPPGGAGPA